MKKVMVEIWVKGSVNGFYVTEKHDDVDEVQTTENMVILHFPNRERTFMYPISGIRAVREYDS